MVQSDTSAIPVEKSTRKADSGIERVMLWWEFYIDKWRALDEKPIGAWTLQDYSFNSLAISSFEAFVRQQLGDVQIEWRSSRECVINGIIVLTCRD